MIIEFKHKALIGKPCFVDEDFVHLLNLMCDLAFLMRLKLYINQAFTKSLEQPNGAIVKRVSMSNHFVGHAFDCNIIETTNEGTIFWTSEMLENPSENIKDFIKKCKVLGLRWGGDFKKKDVVHFDDGLNIKNPEIWNEKFKAIHK